MAKIGRSQACDTKPYGPGMSARLVAEILEVGDDPIPYMILRPVRAGSHGCCVEGPELDALCLRTRTVDKKERSGATTARDSRARSISTIPASKLRMSNFEQLPAVRPSSAHFRTDARAGKSQDGVSYLEGS